MRSKLLLFLVLLLIFRLPLNSYAQNIDFAREVINHLCSPNLHGRGYVNEGDKKAANYIASQFENFGLQPINDSFLQKFNISVNTLPGVLEISIDNRKLIAGKDYLADPCSPSAKGNFQVMELDKKNLQDQKNLQSTLLKAKGKFILINKNAFKNEDKGLIQDLNQIIKFLKHSDDNPAAGLIIVTDEKLTWHASENVCSIPSVTIFMPEFPGEIRRVRMALENKFHSQYQTQNIIGKITGKRIPDSVVVFSAHYDHLGRMGRDTYFPGANDNASGIALLLDLARHYAQPDHTPDYSMVFMAFGAEEVGLLGSKYYVENPLFGLEQIKFLINMDIAGTGDEGITVVNGKIYTDAFDLLVKINEENNFLPKVNSRGEACNSDHCLFHLRNVPSFFIYTLGGIQAYHDVYDIPETLPLTFYNEYFNLITSFVSALH